MMKSIVNRGNIFSLIVIFLIFINIPLPIQLNFIGGAINDKLIIYPLYFGVLVELYCLYKRKNNVFYDLRDNPYLARGFGAFLVVYAIITFLSLIHGMYIYPYYDAIMNGPAGQIEKLPKVLQFLNQHGIDITEKKLLSLWMIVRPIKGFFVNLFVTYILSFMLFMWCRNRSARYFEMLVKGTLIAVGIILVYSFMDVMYLAHSEWARDVLSLINPYVHMIQNKGSWWPPLLWRNQLRSLFAEPSFFGIYASFSMPLLWYVFVSTISEKRRLAIGFMLYLYTFCLFLTSARTAFALFLGETVLLILYAFYRYNRQFWLKVLIVIAISLTSFGTAVGFITYVQHSKNQTNEEEMLDSFGDYMDSNLNSLQSEDKRSNRSRYSVMKADFETGTEHLFLGVGNGFRTAYVSEKLSQLPKKNHEIETWIARQHELGILKAGIPALDQYTSTFCEGGVLGLLIWLFPPLYLLYHLVLLLLKNKSRHDIAFFLISFIGIMAAGLSGIINVTYCYWILLAMGYALWLDWKNQKQSI